MNGFTDEERAAEEARRRAVNGAQERTALTQTGPTVLCVNCHNTFPISEGYVDAEVSLCDFCHSRD